MSQSIDVLAAKIEGLRVRVYDNWERQEAFAVRSRADRSTLNQRTAELERRVVTNSQMEETMRKVLREDHYVTETGLLAATFRSIQRASRYAVLRMAGVIAGTAAWWS